MANRICNLKLYTFMNEKKIKRTIFKSDAKSESACNKSITKPFY